MHVQLLFISFLSQKFSKATNSFYLAFVIVYSYVFVHRQDSSIAPRTIKASPSSINTYGTSSDAPIRTYMAVATITTKIPNKMLTSPNSNLLPVKTESSARTRPAAISSGPAIDIGKLVAISSAPITIKIAPTTNISLLINISFTSFLLVPYAWTQNSVTS